jgi:hypothetical protein
MEEGDLVVLLAQNENDLPAKRIIVRDAVPWMTQ